MKKAFIEVGRKKDRFSEDHKLPPKDKEEIAGDDKQKSSKSPVVADISHIYNHKLLDVYSKYFNDDELLNDKMAMEEKHRKIIASFTLKNYQLDVDSKKIEILEIEIYSHVDPYLSFLMDAFNAYKEKRSPQPRCLVFCVDCQNPKAKGQYYVIITSLAFEGKIIEGREGVFTAVSGKKYNVGIKDPSLLKDYDFKLDPALQSAPRRDLNFSGCTDSSQLNLCSKNIMNDRSYSYKAKLFNDDRKILYAYQLMRNNEGNEFISNTLQVKVQKLSMWMRKFYKIPEIKDPNYFLQMDYRWDDFEERLKAFKYFTQFI